MLSPEREEELKAFAARCGVKLGGFALLEVALTHATYAFEKGGKAAAHNERLEFVGDAVLGLIIADYLYHAYPALSEGELSKARAAVVCRETLFKKAKELELGKYLRLGKGEEKGGREKASILAGALEAVIGAFYLEGGLEEARKFVLAHFIPEIEAYMRQGSRDYKTLLQEEVQKKYEENVSYVVLRESGPEHAKSFLVGVLFRGRLLGTGEGKSKKEAEQNAAREALEKKFF